MSQQQLLMRVVDALESVGVEYLITGSWASTLQGEPRSTHNVDLVISLQGDQVDRFYAAIVSERLFLDLTSVQNAVHNRSMFNLLDTSEGDKIDFWLLTDDAWDQSRWNRRQKVELWNRTFGYRLPRTRSSRNFGGRDFLEEVKSRPMTPSALPKSIHRRSIEPKSRSGWSTWAYKRNGNCWSASCDRKSMSSGRAANVC